MYKVSWVYYKHYLCNIDEEECNFVEILLLSSENPVRIKCVQKKTDSKYFGKWLDKLRTTFSL